MEPTELEALKLERTASVSRYVYNWGWNAVSSTSSRGPEQAPGGARSRAHPGQTGGVVAVFACCNKRRPICGPPISTSSSAGLAYKALRNSKHFVQVDRFFPSTKLCSECGYKNDDPSLGDREWTCPGCRTHDHRDANAAKNVRVEGLRILAEGHPETVNACGLRVSRAEACMGLKQEKNPPR